MDRKQLKAQSKNLIRTAQPKPVVTAIIYLLIISVLGFLSYKLVGGSSFELQSVYEQFGIGYDVGFAQAHTTALIRISLPMRSSRPFRLRAQLFLISP